jgi:hypothetical protein
MGGTTTLQLGDAIGTLRLSVGDLAESLEGGGDRATDLSGRARDIADALAAVSAELDERVPAALARVEEQAGRTRIAATSIVPRVEAIEASADGAAKKLAEAEASLARQEPPTRAPSSLRPSSGFARRHTRRPSGRARRSPRSFLRAPQRSAKRAARPWLERWPAQ